MKRLQKLSKKTIQTLCALSCIATMGVVFNAHAEECSSNADCSEGELCEFISTGLIPCSIDEEGNEICDEVEEIEVMGFCEERPIECEEDSDCPSHLSCGWGDSISVGSTSGGAMSEDAVDSEESDPAPPPVEEEDRSAEQPDELPIEEPTEEPPVEEEEAMMCVFIPAECQEDNDCAMNFHCETYEVGLDCVQTGVPCQEGEDCPQPEPIDCGDEDEVETRGTCLPDEIECDNDDMCPTDWRCHELIESDCPDIAIGAEPAEAEPTPDVPERSDDESTMMVECVESTRSLCIPVGLDSSYGVISDRQGAQETNAVNEDNDIVDEDEGMNPTDLDSEPGDESDNEPGEGSSNSDLEDDGGCDASHTAPTSWALLGLLALLSIRRRVA